MINAKTNPVEWALLVSEMEEAAEHLSALIEQMASDEGIEESDFAVQMGHVYAHLNRTWHSRHGASTDTEEAWAKMSVFPTDIEMVG